LSRRRLREIDDATRHERTAIVDTNGDRHPGRGQNDANTRSEWQGSVRCGELIGIIAFSVRRSMALKCASIERRNALLRHSSASERSAVLKQRHLEQQQREDGCPASPCSPLLRALGKPPNAAARQRKHNDE
jgi:hypothetical protein